MNPESIKESRSLIASIEDSWRFYSLKYFKEVLGIKKEELELFLKALKGRLVIELHKPSS